MEDIADDSIALTSSETVLESGVEQCSKNQLKRKRREEYLKVKKQAKKAAEKEKKYEKKAIEKAAKAVKYSEESKQEESKQSTEENIDIVSNENKVHRKSRKERDTEAKEDYIKACSTNFGIIIDCNWENEHSDSTIKSLTQQIMFSYGVNRRHSHPAQLHLTGLGPRVTERLTKVLFDSWIGVTKSAEDYLANTTDFSIEAVDVGSAKKQLVYLTSDAEETLETLESNCVYIIGGIVDRNRLKGATYNKAKLQGVRTAKLPIKENFAMACTHILTVNHVYEILLNYAQDGNWTSAIERVIPKRKGLELRSAGGQTTTDSVNGDDGDDLEGVEETNVVLVASEEQQTV